jgi:hypothetical protein
MLFGIRRRVYGRLARQITLVKPAYPIDTLGHENGRFLLEHSVLSKIDPACAASLEVFSKQRALKWL